MGISIREYARRRQISDTAVHHAIKQDRITKEPDGTINPEQADQDWLCNTSNPRIHVPESKTSNTRRCIPVAKSATDVVRKTLADSGQPIGDDEQITYHHAKEANEILKAELTRLEINERKGKLIEVDKISRHVFQVGRQIRDAWQNWPMRIANEMAAELGIDGCALQITLEEAVRAHLFEISELDFAYDDSIEVEQSSDDFEE